MNYLTTPDFVMAAGGQPAMAVWLQERGEVWIAGSWLEHKMGLHSKQLSATEWEYRIVCTVVTECEGVRERCRFCGSCMC